MALEQVATYITDFTSFAYIPLVIMFIYCIIKGFSSGESSSWGGGGGILGKTKDWVGSLGRREREKIREEDVREERDTQKTEKFVEREWYELKKVKEELEAAKNTKNLKKIKGELKGSIFGGLETVEKRMAREFKRFEEHGKKLAKTLKNDKKVELEKELANFKKYNEVLEVTLSRNGILERALLYPEPEGWNQSLFGEMKKAGQNQTEQNFKARQANSLTVINAVIKWEDGLLTLLKKYGQQLKEIESELES